MKLAVSELRPNSYRSPRHPTDRDKVEALKNSIDKTTFWDNLLARPALDGNGHELAYGFHRLIALRELNIPEIDIPVRDISDTLMTQIMAQENMAEWSHNASVEQETVRVIIEAYGRGAIDLPQPKLRAAGARYAPSFQISDDSSARALESDNRPYTVATLCDFLGWKRYKIDAALTALELIEVGVADRETFTGLTSRQADAVVTQAKRILNDGKEADPKKSAKIVAQGLAAGMRKSTGTETPQDNKEEEGTGKGKGKGTAKRAEVTIHTAKHKADEMLGRNLRKAVTKKPPNLPDINRFATSTAVSYNKVIEKRADNMAAIVKHRDYLGDGARKTLIGALRNCIRTLSNDLAKLDPEELRREFDDMSKSGVLLQLPYRAAE